MKIRVQLLLGFGIIYGIFTILSTILVLKMENYNQNNEMTIEHYQILETATTIKDEVMNYQKEEVDFFANPREDLLTELTIKRNAILNNVNEELEQLTQLEVGEESRQTIEELNTTLRENTVIHEKVESLMREGKSNDASQLYWGEGRDIREKMISLSAELQKLQNDKMKRDLEESSFIYQNISSLATMSKILDYFLGSLIFIWLLFSLTRRLNNVSSVMSEVNFERLDKLPRIKVKTKDEIGKIAIAYNEMAEALEKHTKQEMELKIAAEEQSWLKTKVAEMANLYPNASDIESLAKLFIKKICSIVGAQYGVFYLKKNEGKEEWLQKVGTYAYSQQTIGVDRLGLGEGVVGEAAVENKTILLHDIPEEYIKINSGLITVTPKTIMVVPAEFQGEVTAVIELASIKSFSKLEKLLITEVMSNLGINIKNLLRHLQVENLLQESRVLTEELQVQSEELQAQQEELRAINEQLEVQNESSQQKTRELEEVKSKLEEKANQLTLSSQYKSEFLANMSHELRTPLNSLLILSQMLANNDEKNLTPKQVTYAQTIYSSGNDLLYLINDILDISKIEAGKMDITIQEVDLIDVKRFVEAQFQPLASQKNIEFKVEMEAELPKSIYTDHQRLQQILKNLLSNAFKFTEQGSISLTIESAGKKLPAKPGNFKASEGVVAFSVKDTGIGIPAEFLDIIFEAFKQVDGKINRKYGGTGLGLSISRELSRLLGGFIEVESREGIGSTFTLYLADMEFKNSSFAQSEVAAGLETEARVEENHNTLEYPSITKRKNSYEKEGSLEGKKILLVDDDMRNIFALTTILESHQVEVLFAENGEEGIETLENNPGIEMVLMDIMMPGMDGFEAMHIIRSNPIYEDLPIIALTAKATDFDRRHCIEAGASDYISKPVKIEQLISVMQVWLYKSAKTG